MHHEVPGPADRIVWFLFLFSYILFINFKNTSENFLLAVIDKVNEVYGV